MTAAELLWLHYAKQQEERRCQEIHCRQLAWAVTKLQVSMARRRVDPTRLFRQSLRELLPPKRGGGRPKLTPIQEQILAQSRERARKARMEQAAKAAKESKEAGVNAT